MNTLNQTMRHLFGLFAIAAMLLPVCAYANELPEMVDNFSHQSQTAWVCSVSL